MGSVYNFGEIVAQSKLMIDSRNATRTIDSPKIVRCQGRSEAVTEPH